MKRKILFSLLVAVVLSSFASAQIVRGEKTSVKSIYKYGDKFTGATTYKSGNDSACSFDGPFITGLSIDVIPALVISNDGSSVDLSLSYTFPSKDEFLSTFIFMNGKGEKLTIEVGESNWIVSQGFTLKGSPKYVYNCTGKITKEEYDILRDLLTEEGIEGAAYVTKGNTYNLKPKGKKSPTVFNELEKAANDENANISFTGTNDGVIKISKQ